MASAERSEERDYYDGEKELLQRVAPLCGDRAFDPLDLVSAFLLPLYLDEWSVRLERRPNEKSLSYDNFTKSQKPFDNTCGAQPSDTRA